MLLVDYYARPASHATGGVNRTRQEWLAKVAADDVEVTILNADGGFTDELAGSTRMRFLRLTHIGRTRGTMIAPGLLRHLRGADLLYLNEGWTLSNIWAACMARLVRVPYVVMPHGVYERQIVGTLRPLPLRRRLERFVLEGARAVHLFFDDEQDEVRLIAPRARTVVLPVGFDPLEIDRGAHLEDVPYLAWLGRFDTRHKGVDVLLRAMHELSPERRPFLRMRGPDYHGGTAEARSLVDRYGLHEWVSVEAPLAEHDAQRFVAESRGFVHVPRWEALGRTVVDALLVGVPVIISDRARISTSLREAGVARVVALDPSAIGEALADTWTQDPNGSADVRERRAWALEYFDWTRYVTAWRMLFIEGE